MTDDTASSGRARKLISPPYVAGIIDGEGSIFSRGRNPHVSVSNTSQKLIEELVRFGGHTQVRNPRRGMGTLPGWDWALCGEKAAIMLRACLPYLVIKQDKAVEALLAWKQVTGSNHYLWVVRAHAEMLPLLDGEWLRVVRRANGKSPVRR